MCLLKPLYVLEFALFDLNFNLTRSEGACVSFIFYLIFVSFVFVKPFETIAPEMAQYNPMVYFAIFTLAAAAPQALNSKLRVATPLHFACLIGLIITIALSWLTKGWVGGAGQSLLRSAPSLVLFLLTLVLVTSRQRLNTLLAFIVLLVTFIVSVALFDYHYSTFNNTFVLMQSGVTQDSSVTWTSAGSSSDVSSSIKRLRWIGELSDPNDLGQVIILALPLLFSFWRSDRFLLNLLVIALPAITLLYGVFLTQSRGAIVGLVAVVFVLVYRRYGRNYALLLSPIVLVALIMGGGTGGREFSTSESSASGRLDAWSAGIEMLRSNPITGVGFGGFLDHHILTAHNSFVLVFAELGLIGYFFWFGLIVVAAMELLAGYRARITSGTPPQELAFISQSFVGYLACAWFLSRSYSNSFFLLIGLTICAGRLAYLQISSSDRIAAGRWFRLTTLYSLFSIIFIYLLLIVNNLILK